MKKSARGSVGRIFSSRRRYKEDEVYREKQKERRRKYQRENREKELARHKEWRKKLNEFANKRCVVCNKLLYYKNKSGFCKKHWGEHFNKIIREKQKNG